ncbi:MAG: glycosyltransferase family 9 protein [Pseudomonadota bacterium]
MADNILFITSNRLGDAVLSTAVLAALLDEHPQARLTIACGPLPAPLFATMPNRPRLIPMPKRRYGGHWWRLWREVARERWDIVVDLRDSAVSRLVRARKRLIFRALPDSAGRHKVDQFAERLKLPTPLMPRLWFSDSQISAAREHMQPEKGPILAVGPAANWAGKEWPMDRYQALIDKLTASDGPLPQARVAVSAAPNERQQAIAAWDRVPEDRQIDLMRNTDPAFAAACLTHVDLYVGNDSGLMHIAAAVGVPTVGLFGPSDDRIYAPYGPRTTWVRSPISKAELIRAVDAGERPLPSLMDEIDSGDVEVACHHILNATHEADPAKPGNPANQAPSMVADQS